MLPDHWNLLCGMYTISLEPERSLDGHGILAADGICSRDATHIWYMHSSVKIHHAWNIFDSQFCFTEVKKFQEEKHMSAMALGSTKHFVLQPRPFLQAGAEIK